MDIKDLSLLHLDLSSESKEACLCLMPRLTVRERQVFVLVVFYDLDQTDVAAVLGVSEPAVSKHMRNIRARARGQRLQGGA